jgi:Transposase IS116/IS110/IS902 family
MTPAAYAEASATHAEHREPKIRLSRDLVKASSTMTAMEARYMVDAYYLMQDDRKRAHNQVRAMDTEPHTVIGWLAEQSEVLEHQIRRALDEYSDNHAVGPWLKSNHGIGPVIAAGLLAHIDIRRAPTVGHIWRFAGLDPSVKWGKGEKRPFNGALKVLCWKIGQSFMKFSGDEKCVYGAVYREHKAKYVARNDGGEYAARAAELLTEKKWSKDTDAWKHLTGGKLPPAQIDARARRYAVKLFLSHLHCVWWFIEHKELPAAPYAIAHRDHTHFIDMPNQDVVEGLREALRKRGWLN